MSIVIAILIFSFLIISHEFGHFIFAKKAGIGVTEFNVGFGPTLLSRKKGETTYALKAIPFGGACVMVGEDEENDAENSFQSKSVWRRISVVFGGPLFNFLFAFVLALVLMFANGINPPKISRVDAGYGAEKAGLAVGDEIVSINGDGISLGREVTLYLLSHPLDGSDVTVEYERDGVLREAVIDPNYTVYRLGISYQADAAAAVLTGVGEGSPAAAAGLVAGDVVRAIDGVSIASGAEMEQFFAEHRPDGTPMTITCLRAGKEYTASVTPAETSGYTLGLSASNTYEKAGLFASVKGAVQEVGYNIKTVFVSLKMLFTGQASAKDLMGPVGIVSVIDNTIEESQTDGAFYVFLNLLNISVLLSANLGVVNLFPLPALDGGRLLLLIVEAVTKKRLPAKVEGVINMVGFGLLMALMVFVLFNDVTRLFG